MTTILYITHNGVTDHIGQSQIAPYLLNLAKAGFRIHLLSAEKKERAHLVNVYERLFEDAGISWSRVRYISKPPLVGQMICHINLVVKARRIARQRSVRIVHCRSHLAAMIGRSLKRTKKDVRYIFDFRDFWPDGGVLKSGGVVKLIYRGLKKMERDLVRDADRIVCLTRRATEMLSKWYGVPVENRFIVIPCCADFDLFRPGSARDRSEFREKLCISTTQTVLLYLGSLGPDYLLEDMLRLFLELKKLRCNSVFLFVCNNGENEILRGCNAIGIAAEDIRFISAERGDIPALIGIADLSVIFIRNDDTKAGCSPTKLAELFACNVPVVANKGVGDLDDLLKIEENGSVAIDLSEPESMANALSEVLSKRINIREKSGDLSLNVGTERYASIYRELI